MGNLHGPVQWGSVRMLWWKGRVPLLPLLPTKGGSYDLHPDTPRLVMLVIFLDVPLGRLCRRLDHLRESELTDLGVEGTRDRFRSNAVELESRILSNRRSNVRSNRTRSNTRSNRTRSNTRSNRTRSNARSNQTRSNGLNHGTVPAASSANNPSKRHQSGINGGAQSVFRVFHELQSWNQ